MHLSYEEMRALSRKLKGDEIEEGSRDWQVLNSVQLRLELWLRRKANSQKQDVIKNHYT